MGCLHGSPTCVNGYYAASAAPFLGSLLNVLGASEALQNECLIKLCTLICNFILPLAYDSCCYLSRGNSSIAQAQYLKYSLFIC